MRYIAIYERYVCWYINKKYLSVKKCDLFLTELAFWNYNCFQEMCLLILNKLIMRFMRIYILKNA